MPREAGRAWQQRLAGLEEEREEGWATRAMVLETIPPAIFLTHTSETSLCLLLWSSDNPGGNQGSQP